MTTQVLRHIEADLLVAAARRRVVEDVGPFRAFIDPDTGDPGQSFAVPVRRWNPDAWRGEIAALDTLFARHGRSPRAEVFDRLWPGLGDRLLMAGWSTELRSVVMIRPTGPPVPQAAPPADLAVRLVAGGGRPADMAAFLKITRSAFEISAEIATPGEITRLTDDLAAGRLVVALLEGPEGPVACGSLLVGHRLVELADVGTLHSHRRLGCARVLCAALLEHPAAVAARAVWLSTANGRALALYGRHLGFRPAGGQTCFRRYR
ncbi:MAG: GNAT family N-acetyltransferase [Rhodospirillaceae bacterium]|nr:GNAT family N-acetyltransferase [Rhodospirillaceae bacterium]MCA8932170.1 GNAT family N-acetyltransferase [Rhodospirillaceae bacterium]